MQFNVRNGTPPLTGAQALQRMRWIVMLACTGITAIHVGFTLYVKQFNASGLEIGFFYGIGALTSALSRPVFGRVMDTYGRRPVLIIGLGLIVASSVAFALANSVALLLVANTLHGLGLGTLLLSAYTITSDLAQNEGMGAHFGVTEEAQYRGGIYGGLLALPILLFTGFSLDEGLRITRLVWGVSFSLYAIAALIALILAFRLVPETHNASQRLAQVRDERPTFGNRYLNIVLMVVLLTSASAYAIQPFTLRYVQDTITANVAWIGLAYLPAALANSILYSTFGKLSDRVGRKPPMIIALTTSAALSLLVAALVLLFTDWDVLPKMLVLMLFNLLESCAYAASIPAEQALVSQITGGRQRGMAFGLYTLAQSAGKAVGPILMGGLSDGFAEAPFFVNAAILFVGAYLVWRFVVEPKREPG